MCLGAGVDGCGLTCWRKGGTCLKGVGAACLKGLVSLSLRDLRDMIDGAEGKYILWARGEGMFSLTKNMVKHSS